MSRPNIIQNYEAELNTLLDLYRGHSYVHPDRGQCGGVGRCLMMRTEVDQEQELEDYLRQIAHLGHLRIELVEGEDDGTD